MPRGKPKSTARAANARKNPSMSAWRRALKEFGYMQKGSAFKPVPKKGTAAYNQVRKRMDEIKGGR